jgi:glutamine synthetase
MRVARCIVRRRGVATKVEPLFSSKVFDEVSMQERLPANVFKAWKECVSAGVPLDREVGNVIATALKDWAREHGVTHYSHWFQPWSGGPAEKHDGFIQPKLGGALSHFSGSRLLFGETDGSSFPSGGLRVTHEARGYTAWDPSSHPFIYDLGDPTLFIPSVFYSWKGHALDRKIPLLRSIEALKRETFKIYSACGLPKISSVHSEAGIEQEFFLLDAQHVAKRPDLQLTGRTLQGSPPAKGQELSDSYFGPMTSKTLHVIHEMEVKCWELGIPVTTRHREVCPNQYEIAPIFSTATKACDQNLQMMNIMEQVARKHGLVAIFHEKPFAHVNGSGKHNNWSIGTDLRGTLFGPGANPEQNIEFLLALAATIRGADLHANLLRWSISGAGNDCRLGGHEAPPAIISVYLGAQLSSLVQSIVTGSPYSKVEERQISLGIPHMPVMVADAGDRNRTSPFAFTGNKFEVRAVGSSQHPSASTTVLNSMVADSFRFMGNEVRSKVANGVSKRDATMEVIRETLKKHQRIIFDGNGYSPEWVSEAKRRGLANLRTTPDVLSEVSKCAKSKELFSSLGVYTPEEFSARNEVMYETYNNKVNIEAQVLLSMARQHILPAALDTQRALNQAVPAGTQPHVGHAKATGKLAALVGTGLDQAEILAEHRRTMNAIEDPANRARYAVEQTLGAMANLRETLDVIETRVDARVFPFPSYQTMLFHKHH